MWKPQPYWLIADWLVLMESARRGSCPSGQRRGPAAPGEDKFPSPDQKAFHTSTTPTTRGRKRSSPRSTPPSTVWNPQPYWLIADWLGLMEPARGRSFPSGQRRGRAAPGRGKAHRRMINISILVQLQQPGDENGDPPGRYRHTRCGNPDPTD